MSISPGMELSAAAQAQAVGESMELSRDKIDEVKLALIEACINAFEHAGAAQRVELGFRVVNGGPRGAALEVTVSDRGPGFDPEAVEPPVLEKKLGGGYKRGWGLKIIKNFMDEVEIRSGEKGTTIVMRKYR